MSAAFVFIGARPQTDWLGDTVARDAAGLHRLRPRGEADRRTAPLARRSAIPSPSRPACRASSWPGTSATSRSSAWRRRSGRARWRCSSCTSTSAGCSRRPRDDRRPPARDPDPGGPRRRGDRAAGAGGTRAPPLAGRVPLRRGRARDRLPPRARGAAGDDAGGRRRAGADDQPRAGRLPRRDGPAHGHPLPRDAPPPSPRRSCSSWTGRSCAGSRSPTRRCCAGSCPAIESVSGAIKGVERDREKLLAVGKLAAGLAHELNNPAAAAARGVATLREYERQRQDAFAEIAGAGAPAERLAALASLGAEAAEQTVPGERLDPLAESDREQELRRDARAARRPGRLRDRLRAHGGGPRARLGRSRRGGSRRRRPRRRPALRRRLRRRARRARRAGGGDHAHRRPRRRRQELLVPRPGAAPDGRHPRGAREHALAAGAQAAREADRDRPRPRPRAARRRGVGLRAEPGLDEPHRQRDRRRSAPAGGSPCARAGRASACASRSATTGRGSPPTSRRASSTRSSPRSRSAQGTGLGLDIVQRIVVRHHGELRLQSEPGDTRFQVLLPIR